MYIVVLIFSNIIDFGFFYNGLLMDLILCKDFKYGNDVIFFVNG